MLNKEQLKTDIICVILILLTALSTKFNLNFSINISNTIFRFNILSTLFLCVLLILLSLNGARKKKFDYLYLLFILYCFINTLLHLFDTNVTFASGLEAILTLTLPFIVVRSYATIEKNTLRERVIKVIKILGYYIAVQVFFSSLIGSNRGWVDTDYSRTSTTIGESNCTAYFLVCICLLSMLCFIRERRKIDLFQLIVTSIAVLMSLCRGAIGCLVMMYAVTALFCDVKGRLKVIVLFLTVGIAVFIMKPDILMDVYLRIFSNQSMESNSIRQVVRQNALAHFKEHPLLGSGNGLLIGRLSRVNYYLSDIANPHNQWVALLAETGIIGTSLFALSQVSYLFDNYGNNRYTKIASLTFLIYLLAGFQFETLYTGDIRASLCFWIYFILIHFFSAENTFDEEPYEEDYDTD